MLYTARCVCKGQGNGQGDEVDVGDVGEDLVAVECELTEVPVGVDVWVRGVGDGGFDEAGAGLRRKVRVPLTENQIRAPAR
jgi:hypothetical protein